MCPILQMRKLRPGEAIHPKLHSRLLAESMLCTLSCSHFQTNESSAGLSYESGPFPSEVLPKGSQAPLALPGAERGWFPPTCRRAALGPGEEALWWWEPGEGLLGDSSALRIRQQRAGPFLGDTLTGSQVHNPS